MRALKRALNEAAIIYITDADVDEDGVIINTEGFPDATWSLSAIQDQRFRVSGNFKTIDDDTVELNNIELRNLVYSPNLWKGLANGIEVSLVSNRIGPDNPISWTLEVGSQIS